MTYYTVRDGARQLNFSGTLLAESSSEGGDRARWVEFKLYRTAGGNYVLARIGVSHYVHSGACSTVRRNSIKPVAVESFTDGNNTRVPCPDCGGFANTNGDVLYPEQPRYWAQTSKTPEGVIECLYKYDQHETKYLTHVAERLLADAAEFDNGIRSVYLNEAVA